MAFSVISKKSGKTYFLHHRLQKLRGGQEVTLYYFGGEAKEGALDALPEGYEVSENARTGLPLLKKKAK
jgi:hypothetical protein